MHKTIYYEVYCYYGDGEDEGAEVYGQFDCKEAACLFLKDYLEFINPSCKKHEIIEHPMGLDEPTSNALYAINLIKKGYKLYDVRIDCEGEITSLSETKSGMAHRGITNNYVNTDFLENLYSWVWARNEENAKRIMQEKYYDEYITPNGWTLRILDDKGQYAYE